MIKALIIDDEEDARNLLREFIDQFCENVHIEADFESPVVAFKYLEANHQSVDLIYLDISMPYMDGISFLRGCRDFNIQTIFVTAHDDYAIQAIRLSAIDYILKPIDIDLLISATEKAVKIIEEDNSTFLHSLDNFISNYDQSDREKKIMLNTGNEIHFVKLKDIVCIEADGSYSHVFLDGGEKLMITERLGVLEGILNYPFMYRVHRGFLINLHKVHKYQKGRGGLITMSNGVFIPVAQRNKLEFLNKLKQLR